MRYLCLCYSSEELLERMPQPDLDVLFDEQVACDEALRRRGTVLESEALEPVRSATTVRVRNGKVSVTDGPFAETKEQLGGFFLIEARDLNDAVRVAARFPSARYGSMEIRPIWEIRDFVADLRRRTASAARP